MIDRLFAIWQELYPDSYVEPEPQTQNTYWYQQGQTLDADSRKTLARTNYNANHLSAQTILLESQWGFLDV
jgi:tyrosinase